MGTRGSEAQKHFKFSMSDEVNEAVININIFPKILLDSYGHHLLSFFEKGQ